MIRTAMLAVILVQQITVPGRAERVTPIPAQIGTNTHGSFADQYRLPDGRMQWFWSFWADSHYVDAGGPGLTLDVVSEVPLLLALYRVEQVTGRENLVERRDLGGPTPIGESRRPIKLTRPGFYVLSATTANAEAPGQRMVYIGLNSLAQPPTQAMSPQPPMKAIPAAPPKPPEGLFQNLALSATQARFGEHVSLVPSMTDVPPGCKWDAKSVDVQGLLPPGLRLTPNSLKIEGTPRHVGSWTFTYSVRGVFCAGSAVNYGDRSASVTFTVLP